MPSPRPILAALAAAMLALPAAPAPGQDEFDTFVPTETRSRTIAAEVRLLDIDFAGGTLAEFAGALRAAAGPHPVNVILTPEAQALLVPPMNLRRVTAEAALGTVASLCGAAVEQFHSPGESIFTLDARQLTGRFGRPPDGPPETDADRRRREAIARRDEISAAQSAPQPAHLRVYSVRDFVDGAGITYETVLDALRTALSVGGGEPEAEVLHHEASGVLIVRGTQTQQGLAEQMLEAIRRDSKTLSAAEREREERRMMLSQSMIRMQSDLGQADVRITAATEKLEQTRKLADEGFASDGDITDATQALEMALLNKERVEAQLAALRADFDALAADAGPEPSPHAHRRAELEARLRTLGFQIRRAEIDVRATEEALAEAEKLVKGNFVPPSSVTQARQAFEGAKLNMEQAEAEHAAVKDQLAALDAAQPTAAAAQPLRTYTSGFSSMSPAAAIELFTSLNKMMEASGARGYIEISRREAGTELPAQLRVQFVGSDEANEHFKAYIDGLLGLGMVDAKAHD